MLEKINLHYLYSTRRYLMMAVAAVVLAVAITLFAIVPQIQSAVSLYSSLQKEQTTVSQLRRKDLELQQLPLSQAFNRTDQVNQVLPSKKPLIEILAGLSESVQKAQVSVTNIELAPGSIATASGASAGSGAAGTGGSSAGTSGPASPKVATKKGGGAVRGAKDYQTLEIQLKVMGDLNQINALLANVEKMAPMSTVTDITLGKDAKAGKTGSNRFEATLVVTSYYFTKSIAATLESQLPDLGAPEQKVLDAIAQFNFPSQETKALTVQGGGLKDLFGVGSEGAGGAAGTGGNSGASGGVSGGGVTSGANGGGGTSGGSGAGGGTTQ